jgi:hypothetical protein
MDQSLAAELDQSHPGGNTEALARFSLAQTFS